MVDRFQLARREAERRQQRLRTESAAAKRQAAAADMLRSAAYKGAQTTGGTLNWYTPDGDVNDLIGGAQTTVRNRVHDLIRNFPIFQAAIESAADVIVGQGHRFESQVVDEISGAPDQTARRQIEKVLRRAMEPKTADYGKRLHFDELQAFAVQQDLPNGEYLALWEQRPDPERYIPVALNFIEPSRLTEGLQGTPAAGAAIKQGVEYSKLTGEGLGYWIQNPESFSSVRYPAKYVLHNYRLDRPGQLRGISKLACTIILAYHLGEMIASEVEAGNMQSRWLAFVKTPSIDTYQALRQAAAATRGAANPGLKTDELMPGKKIDQLDHAIVEYLRGGEDVTFAAPNRPSGILPSFARFVYQSFSAVLKLPYEIVSGDYTQLNYSTVRTSRNDQLHSLKRRWFRHRVHYCQPWQYRAMDMAVVTGKLNLRNYWLDPYHYYAGLWIPPGQEPVDPLRETKAHLDQIAAGLKAPQEIILATGRDPETVVRQIAEWKRMLADAGLEWGDAMAGGSTALQNNPAALGAKQLPVNARQLVGGGKFADDIAHRLEDLMNEYGLDGDDLRYFLHDLAPEETPA